MVKQYSKIAKGTVYKRVTSKSYTINTNTNFTINDAIVFIQDANQAYGVMGVRLKDFNYTRKIWTDYGRAIEISLNLQNSNQLVINMNSGDGYFVKEWIAIN